MISLDRIDEMEPWSISHGRCPVCKKIATRFTNSRGKLNCMDCFQKQLEVRLIREDISLWTWERFSLSLSSLGSMKDRLTALIHFTTFQTMERLPEFLIENLGFDSVHPLAWYARQKAYEACLYFRDKEKILKTLLNIKKYTSWQQKANVAKAGYGIDPSSPIVKQIVIQMALDLSPNVRSHVADTIKGDKQVWAKTLFKKLSFDNNPLVREACRIGIKDPTAAPNANQGFMEKRKIRSQPLKKQKYSYNQTEMLVLRHFDLAMPEKVFELYLSHIPDNMDKDQYTEKELASLAISTEDSIVRLLSAFLTDKFLFKIVLEKLPEKVVMLLYLFLWEFRDCESQILEQKLLQLREQDPPDTKPDTKTDTKPDTTAQMPLHEAVKKDPAYFMFQVRKNWAYNSAENTYVISISELFKPFLKKIMPVPDFIHLTPVPTIKGQVEQVYKNNQDIFKHLPVILSFIGQGNLKFSKTGKKVLISSIKKMSGTCQINEYYNNGGNELNYLKTKLLADFFSCMPPWKPKDLEDLPGFIKDKVTQYFSFEAFENHRSRASFDYIKHQMDFLDSNHSEKKIRGGLKQVFTLLPKGQWISINNLALAAFYNGIHFNPFSEFSEFNDLYISMNTNARYYKREREHIYKLSNYDVLTLPFIKTMMFLFGALGMVDLGYSSPENTICRTYDKSWLSVFDGLKYVRLTEFGNYIAGRKKRFNIDIKQQSVNIEIDEHKTMLSIYGEDPVKQMALEAVGQPINRSSYMVDYQSFLKDCTTFRDVKEKIQFFRDNIVEKPPIIWEKFFQEVLARMDPLEPVPAMGVFRLKPDKELLILLTTDKILKKYVIRAENYHILIKSIDFSKVKKRLIFFGFFIS
jgi:hypothetical protein